MKTIKIDSYEIKKSRSGHDVPVINGVHLHSVYNPIKEAASMVAKNKELLEKKKDVLVLGLGFAYHVEEILRILKEGHGDNLQIVVIEPNKDVYKDARFATCLKHPNIKIYFGDYVESYFSDLNLVTFLASRPAVIAHPASFNLYSKFFQNFLTYKAPTNIYSVSSFIDSTFLKQYLLQYEQCADINSMVNEQIENKGSYNENYDFLLMAFDRMVSPQQTKSEA